MTVTHTTRIACAVLIGLVLLLVDAIPAAAHADLVSSSPREAGSDVQLRQSARLRQVPLAGSRSP